MIYNIEHKLIIEAESADQAKEKLHLHPRHAEYDIRYDEYKLYWERVGTTQWEFQYCVPATDEASSSMNATLYSQLYQYNG